MVMGCVAYGCKNKAAKGTNISFHGFPSDIPVLKKWIVAIRRRKFKPSKYSRLCSEHFQKEDFIIRFGKKTLKDGVVPSIFNFPKLLEKNISQERSKRLRRDEISVSQNQEEISSGLCQCGGRLSGTVAVRAKEAAQRALAEQQTLPAIKQEPPSNYAVEPTEEHIKDEIIESELIQVKEEIDFSPVNDAEHKQEVDPLGAIHEEECREDSLYRQNVQETVQQVSFVQPENLDPVSVMFLNFSQRFRALSSKRQLVVKSKLCQVFAEAELEEMLERQ